MRTDKLTKYLRLAMAMAEDFSKDRSTRVGALFLHPDEFTILSMGYNGIPRGCNDDLAERHERPLKYDYFEHAERNAVYNAVRPVLRGSALVVTAEPSMDDVRAIISVGTSVLVVPDKLPSPQAAALLAEAGVRVVLAHDDAAIAHAGLKPAKLRSYLRLAREFGAELSKDSVRPNEALFLHPTEYTLLAQGYSGLPRGISDDDATKFGGGERDFWVESGVRNAVYNAARPLLRGSILVVTMLPCAPCARAVAGVGATMVVTKTPPAEFVDRWGAHFERSKALFEQLGVPVVQLDF